MDGLTNSLSSFALSWLVESNSLLAQAQAGAATGANAVTNPLQTYGMGFLYIFGIFVLPFIISHFVTRSIRMSTHSTRFGLMLASVIAALLFAWANNFKLPLGTDMQGGTLLVYDIVDDGSGNRIDPGSLASALSNRINPSGTKEITIRPRGADQIEIIVPATDELELQKTKELLQNAGQLQFRIVANSRDHLDIIQLAKNQAASDDPAVRLSTKITDSEGQVVGMWVTVGKDEDTVENIHPLKSFIPGDTVRNRDTGEIITYPTNLPDGDYEFEKWMLRNGIVDLEMLMALRSAGGAYTEVSGDDLASANTSYDKLGSPIVSFRLNTVGATKMLSLTSSNLPDGNFHRRMAIIMDENIKSAPQLNSAIGAAGEITGRFTKEEVNFLVTVLRSGRLPATLSDEPAEENRVGAGLGATTVRKGTTASIYAVIATFLAILAYYRFSGIVASIALVTNGLLIFGAMIFIKQPLTLPGLAGLVLTVGMSVDANVLIFERIREEKAKGAAPRMAIRNGFDRALTTIIDSNLTTLIAAFVLYWIGTDQVRGFAVALVIGILTSMFTATFCSRIIFEFAEKLKFVNLSMSDGVAFLKRLFVGARDINFMGWQKICAAISGLAILLGLVAVFVRGSSLLNIDFTGGTSVTMWFQEPVEQEELRALVSSILDTDAEKPIQSTLVHVEREPLHTVYTLVTSIEDANDLSKRLVQGFSESGEAKLVTYRVTKSSATPSSARLPNRLRFVSIQSDTTTEATGGNADPTQETSAGGEAELAVAEPVKSSQFLLSFSPSAEFTTESNENQQRAGIDGPTLRKKLIEAAASAKLSLADSQVKVEPYPRPEKWREEDAQGFDNWTVTLPLDSEQYSLLLEELQKSLQQQPIWLALSRIGSRVADEMQQRAIAAILVSLIFIVGYIWFRFQKVAYGLAAVVALVHDVLITLGVLAVCHWLFKPLGFLLIDDFKIGLTEVAAFLTIIGYSLNDTIVVFDRIREVRGRSPRLSEQMINDSVNQTLSRTLLTSGTTLLTVVLLYVFGGEGIHAFAFALLIGILVGTYSSIFIASPVLLWLSNRQEQANVRA
ncbi:MAG: protein translocase subunit SecD [Planctomycetales bacterium]|nr:protein translocase subunit SecD [Planctomycetales bacterium]